MYDEVERASMVIDSTERRVKDFEFEESYPSFTVEIKLELIGIWKDTFQITFSNNII